MVRFWQLELLIGDGWMTKFGLATLATVDAGLRAWPLFTWTRK